MTAIILLYLIVGFFILLWIYAAVPKFFNLKRFSNTLKTQSIPKWLASLLTWTLPATELLIAYLLIVPKTRLMGMYISFLMMLVFTLYVGGIIFQVYKTYPCPCGALFKNMGWNRHFKVNLLITLVALIGIVLMELGYKIIGN